MTHLELDALWQQAIKDSLRDGETFARYKFAALVAAQERERCAALCDRFGDVHPIAKTCAAAIRKGGEP